MINVSRNENAWVFIFMMLDDFLMVKQQTYDAFGKRDNKKLE